MKMFEEPVIEVQKFNVEDVITTSDTKIPDSGEWN